MQRTHGAMRLDGAFNVFCELGQQKFRGIKHRTVGMDQTHFRRLCRMGLIHGGFKDRDVRYSLTHLLTY